MNEYNGFNFRKNQNLYLREKTKKKKYTKKRYKGLKI